MKATRIGLLVVLAALLAPHWFGGASAAWTGVLEYFAAILVTVLVLIVRAVSRERSALRGTWQS